MVHDNFMAVQVHPPVFNLANWDVSDHALDPCARSCRSQLVGIVRKFHMTGDFFFHFMAGSQWTSQPVASLEVAACCCPLFGIWGLETKVSGAIKKRIRSTVSWTDEKTKTPVASGCECRLYRPKSAIFGKLAILITYKVQNWAGPNVKLYHKQL